MANYQNLHLADKTLFNQYRTLFKTNVSSAQEILDDSQLALKSFRADDHNDLASDISTLENNYYTNVPTRLNSLLANFNNDVSKIKDRGTYSSSTSYYQYNVVSYVVSGNTNLYMCKLPSGTSVISNIAPTNTTYWLYLGLQGDQGSPTIGNLKYVGNWSSSESYSVDDVVTYGARDMYIESTGTQYIDTGLVDHVDYKVIMELEFTSNDAIQRFWGNNYNPVRTQMRIDANNHWVYSIGGSYFTSSNVMQINTRYKLEFYNGISNQYLKINDIQVLSSNKSLTSQTTANNLYLFKCNSTSLSPNGCNMRLYNCKVYHNDNLLRDFIPMFYNNQYCLYDIDHDKYYYNKGTGSFLGMGYDNDNNVLYALKQSSPGTTPPPSNAKWVEIVVLDRRKINFSDSNLTEGDIYWQELT